MSKEYIDGIVERKTRAVQLQRYNRFSSIRTQLRTTVLDAVEDASDAHEDSRIHSLLEDSCLTPLSLTCHLISPN